MQTRRDHVEAHRFATSRLTSAVVDGDPGRGQPPFRRASLGVVAGAIVAALLCGGFVIYGLIAPSPTSWRQQDALIVDEQTGTRFIYLKGELHPTANYASAVLVAGQNAAVHDVSHGSLSGVPVGDTIGIAQAPQVLPSRLLPGVWAICLAPGASRVVLDLAPGRHGTGSTDGRLMLVSGPGGKQYVLWDNIKYQVAERGALVALGLGTTAPVQAPGAWLAGIRSGPPLASPKIPHAGRPGQRVAGQPTPIGTVFEAVAAGSDQYYVMLEGGLAPVSRTSAALLAASGRFGQVRHVSPAVIASAPAAADQFLLNDGLPDFLAGTAYQPTGTAFCIRQVSPGDTAGTTVVTDRAAAGATGVLVPVGAAMLVQPTSAGAGAGAQVTYLVTGTGLKYALASGDTAAALGYSGVTPQVMPASVLSLIPSGPVLSASAAAQEVGQP
jgi:type VII secretion protein EccB